jgi:hypothetical protein
MHHHIAKKIIGTKSRDEHDVEMGIGGARGGISCSLRKQGSSGELIKITTKIQSGLERDELYF